LPTAALRSASLRSASLRCAAAGKTGGEAGEAEDIPLFFTWIPILALLSNYDQEICLIHVGTEGLPEAERNWVAVLTELERLKAWAHSAGALWLAASTLRSQIIVTAEYQNDIRKAELMARQGMEEVRDLAKAKFWVADTMARQHYYFGEATDALRWFETAFASQDAVDATARVNSFTIAGVAASRLGIELARHYLEQGIAAASSGLVGALPRITVTGELGILLWNTGYRRDAYAVWSRAAQELLAVRNETKQWKNLFRLFGNCTGYFILGSRGMPLQDAEITPPFSGILLREIKDILQLHEPEHVWMLPVQMALFAESVGAYDDAVDWTARTKVGGGSFRTAAEALLAGRLVVRDLAEHNYARIVRASDIGDLDEVCDPTAFARTDDDGRAEGATRYFARLNLVAVAIELARIGLHERSRAETIAEDLSRISLERAAHYGGSRFWSAAAEVFGALYKRDTPWRELWQKATDAREQGNSALQMMYGIAATAFAPPREAIQIQLQIVPSVERLLSGTLFHFTMASFVPEFWLWALDQYPMTFGLLSRTRRAVTEAHALDDKPKIRAILRSIASSLEIRVPDYVQRWLDDSSPPA
jgi:hypothetical protein